MFKELEMEEIMDVNGGATATDMGDGTGNTVDRGFASNMKYGLESYWKESREYLPKVHVDFNPPVKVEITDGNIHVEGTTGMIKGSIDFKY
ncbi:hypothetical protein [Fusibacter sp. 3D3]|uniref:hypothetical protein n=1 Tax=Fusibacter sp. 3D3 TaxID=1048380 RepID=UPI0008538C51|nr:hypothetical protein [Fusibacter sp. 3D3]GAU79424.1 hypothetical protein F3D3_4088 [Fusibacter sp. 3D3]